MIEFLKKESWDKFGEQWQAEPSKIIIDTRECMAEEDFVLAIGQVLHASYSTPLIGGYSLDALIDVLSDYFIENWRQYKEIYIVGWQRFIGMHPSFSQRTLLSLMDSYIKAIECQHRAVDFGDDTFENLQFLDALTDNRPRIFLVLN